MDTANPQPKPDPLAALGLTFSAKPSRRTPPANFAGMTPWLCIFHRPATGQRMTVPFYMGSGHGSTPPTGPEVLECLASDAALGSESFPDFCGETGADVDSRKAERSFRQCRRIAERLKALLGAADYERVLYGDIGEALREA